MLIACCLFEKTIRRSGYEKNINDVRSKKAPGSWRCTLGHLRPVGYFCSLIRSIHHLRAPRADTSLSLALSKKLQSSVSRVISFLTLLHGMANEVAFIISSPRREISDVLKMIAHDTLPNSIQRCWRQYTARKQQTEVVSDEENGYRIPSAVELDADLTAYRADIAQLLDKHLASSSDDSEDALSTPDGDENSNQGIGMGTPPAIDGNISSLAIAKQQQEPNRTAGGDVDPSIEGFADSVLMAVLQQDQPVEETSTEISTGVSDVTELSDTMLRLRRDDLCHHIALASEQVSPLARVLMMN